MTGRESENKYRALAKERTAAALRGRDRSAAEKSLTDGANRLLRGGVSIVNTRHVPLVGLARQLGTLRSVDLAVAGRAGYASPMDPVWPPRRSPSPFQTPVRPVHLSGTYRFHVPVPELDPDDKPTQPGGPQGIAYQAAVLVRAFKEGSPEFRAWLMRVCDLEAWAKEK